MKTPTKRKPKAAKREHRWVGAGFICGDCGEVKHEHEVETACPGTGKQDGFDVWHYHAGAGWWLHETVSCVSKAATVVNKKMMRGNVVAIAIVPAGQRLGLFTKERK